MLGRLLSIFVVASSLLGCVEEIDRNGVLAWGKPGATGAEFQKDATECQHDGSMRPVTYTGRAGRAAEMRGYFNDCMNGRGWSLEKTIGIDVTRYVTVDCKLPGVEEVKKLTYGDCNNQFGKIL